MDTGDQQRKARAISVDPGPEDVAFVKKNDGVVAVKGLAQGISAGSLAFRYGDEDRRIGLAKIAGLLLRSNAAAPLAGFHQRVHLDNGDQYSGTLSGLDKTNLVLTTLNEPIRLPIASITTIDFINGRVTSLCDLKPRSVEQTPFFGRVIPYQVDRSLAGGPLQLSGSTVSPGLAVHSRCVLTYDLPGDIDRFKTRLGFQQPQGRWAA